MRCRRGAKMERRFLSGTLMGQLVAEVVVVVGAQCPGPLVCTFLAPWPSASPAGKERFGRN